MARSQSTLITLLLLLLINRCSSHDKCREYSSCGSYPHVRFPFQLVKESSQDQCLYPEFCLYCTQNGETMFLLPTTTGPIKFIVYDIDYESNTISVSDPDYCISEKFFKLNTSSFLPYRISSGYKTKISFFNCSSIRKRYLRNHDMYSRHSQDMITCPIYTSETSDSVLQLDLLSCTKMFDASMMQRGLTINSIGLSWTKQNCTECLAKGMECNWKTNTTKGETECFDCNNKRKTIQIPKPLIYASIGSILFGCCSSFL
ncbi:hypothetical protein P8452_00861 [Trifolium repens]|nr:hypothetical protein P8452_00861 [Trifolium repens]